MAEPLVIEAIGQAIKARQPPIGLVHHSDRGGRYEGAKYRKIFERAKMLQSVSRAADCFDNAIMESSFGTIKTELEMTAYNSLRLRFLLKSRRRNQGIHQLLQLEATTFWNRLFITDQLRNDSRSIRCWCAREVLATSSC